jgi:pyridoxine/pyridoxamine 5'-phosphate oxidase
VKLFLASFLEDNLKLIEGEYEGKSIPRPENWGGYLVSPIEENFGKKTQSSMMMN